MILFRLCLLASLASLYTAFSTDPPKVTLPTGKLEGTLAESTVLKRKFAAFYSIPYAKPPIGQLRFKEPVPAEPWKGTLIATEPPPLCPQTDFIDPVPLKVVGSEDCLYLNVFTPQLPDSNSRLMDVIVIIHGGGFTVSSGNHIDVGRLLDRDVVVVTMNYRLGALGFLSTEDLASPGNNGLKDQNLSLKWIKNNIAYFGGDPNRITIGGCSAGGASVQYQTLSKTSKGLFYKAIPESGSALNPWAMKLHPKKEAIKLAVALGCPTESSNEMIECLKQRPADHIVLKQKPVVPPPFNNEFRFVPSVEPPNPSAFLDKHPRDILVNGEASDVPMLVSFSKDEGILFTMTFLSDPKAMKKLEENWAETVALLAAEDKMSPNRSVEIGEKLKKRYFGDKSIGDNKAGLVKMLGDSGFNAGIEESSKLLAKVNKSPIYAYLFAYPGKITFPMMPKPFPEIDFKGVSHCEQSLYVTPFLGCKIPDDDPMLERALNLTMNFIQGEPLAKNWKPLKDGLPKFTLFNVSSSNWDQNELLAFDDFSNIELWKSLVVEPNESPNKL